MAESNAGTQPDSQIDHAVSIKYWNAVSPTVDGMLGGYPQISTIDLRGSSAFLAKVRRLIPSSGSGPIKQGVDCGAGIGRVTEGFLSRVCESVDIVEPVEKFVAVLKRGKPYAEGKVGDIYITGIEDWKPTKTYDLIWTQWCANHLTDAQLVEFLVRCKSALSETGLLVFKENTTSDNIEDLYDEADSTVTRTEDKFATLFQQAGFTLLRTEEQRGFPVRLGLLPVRFWALRPPTATT
ncbi:Alpha N-terminal protein methyltransferase 1 [Onygenales sp. PD_40]|nr:Alpha N-terminal protein methyltransferase 1 [Onygenales sp. PD_40]KAK2777381.1 Alpha N-terminal protein methyltransferase 1 [Emmonsiellopsis sp. PD_33]KAK2795834.1 Alpha N-terminal protein methyltransferase 1 [Onygenales sp. PD_12]KAK2798018.1 Alpha N-terminal protein methyltransferase 1 [Onygenales sp. PD_10]